MELAPISAADESDGFTSTVRVFAPSLAELDHDSSFSEIFPISIVSKSSASGLAANFAAK
jgi:hypothetical protein